MPRKPPKEIEAARDESGFRSAMQTAAAVAFVLAFVSELASFVLPGFPKDPVGTGVALVVLATAYLAARSGATRRVLGLIGIGIFMVMGWWLARTLDASGGFASPHRDSIYVALAAAVALLPFSAIEFTVLTVMFLGAFIGTGMFRGASPAGANFTILFFYAFGFYVLALLGIVTRRRLQRAELAARLETERLNATLEARVEEQVERARRAELLGRYLPPEIAESVMAGGAGPTLNHARRDVTVLVAVPFGFLESLGAVPADQAARLVNGFVSAMTHLAREHGGVIERFVGPRIIVLFGAIADWPLRRSATQAAQMAEQMQEESNALLRQWEALGVPLRLRMAIGVASGPAVVGTFGSERRVEYSALGEAMVRANMLASAAIPGEARLDALSAENLGGDLSVTVAAPVEVEPGRQTPTFLLATRRLAVRTRGSAEMRAMDLGAFDTIAAGAAPVVGQTTEVSSAESTVRLTAPALASGTMFDGRYRIEERLGRGGMSDVYRALHVGLDQQRAIKLILPDRLRGPFAVEQFRREAEATSRIHHPNVVQLHDFGRSLEGSYYLALEYVEGRSLGELLVEQRRLPAPQAVRIAVELLGALHAAHELRLIHRDIKPANVLLDREERVRVTDFGLAQPIRGQESATDRGLLAGTPAYMSPEQAEGRALDERSDLYSFGVTLYQMLTGDLPYTFPSGSDPFRTILRAEATPILRKYPALPARLADIVDACLAKDPARRPSSADHVRAELLRIALEFGSVVVASPTDATAPGVS